MAEAGRFGVSLFRLWTSLFCLWVQSRVEKKKLYFTQNYRPCLPIFMDNLFQEFVTYSRRYSSGGLNLPDCSDRETGTYLFCHLLFLFFILIKRELCPLLGLERTKLYRDIRLKIEENCTVYTTEFTWTNRHLNLARLKGLKCSWCFEVLIDFPLPIPT